jgi:hypothetical protein
VADNKTARLLKVGLAQLSRLRKVQNPEVKPQDEEPPVPEEKVPT